MDVPLARRGKGLMAWVVDTSVLLDIHTEDPTFGRRSARCLPRYLRDGLVICPVSYIEIAPAFSSQVDLQIQFLQEVGVQWREAWTWSDTEAAHRLWGEYVEKKRARKTERRPVADVLIEAFAQRFDGLITRNPKDFASVRCVVP
jgi:predicted nucleic acid-binding protein